MQHISHTDDLCSTSATSDYTGDICGTSAKTNDICGTSDYTDDICGTSVVRCGIKRKLAIRPIFAIGKLEIRRRAWK